LRSKWPSAGSKVGHGNRLKNLVFYCNYHICSADYHHDYQVQDLHYNRYNMP